MAITSKEIDKLTKNTTKITISSSNDNKQQLGQFYTTNYDYILSNFTIPPNTKTIIEPFVGNGDLLNFITNRPKYNIETYDIEPKYDKAIKQDTLKNPPSYTNKFVLTNPPYLARNKNTDKTLYDKYKCNDLYKCFITNLISDICLGGIIIVPLNFISSIRTADITLRKKFITKYDITDINIFEEQVFDDTSYTVCSMRFLQKTSNNTKNSTKNNTNITIYPSKKTMFVQFTDTNNYIIGGEIYKLPQDSTIKIQRATSKNITNITNILLKCIDDSNKSQLGFKIVNDNDVYIDNTPKLSARSYAVLTINKTLSLTEQEKLVTKMNTYIKNQREKYNSLFLTNYRESNTIARKRISFDLAFRICNYLLSSSV